MMLAGALVQRWWPYIGGWWVGGMLVVWLVVLVVVAWLVRRSVRRGGWPLNQASEDTLRQRYARGEIDRDTYLRLLEEIRSSQP